MPSNWSKKKFMYFAYGSNLLRERLALANPSARFISIGKIEGYNLVFLGESKRWKGGVASIDEKENGEVWGVVWAMDVRDMESLDRQEGRYDPIEVEVTNPVGENYVCRTYQLNQVTENLPPSPHYKDVIAKGARQNRLPRHYLRYLEHIEDNGFDGNLAVYNDVMRLIEDSNSEDSNNESDSEN